MFLPIRRIVHKPAEALPCWGEAEQIRRNMISWRSNVNFVYLLPSESLWVPLLRTAAIRRAFCGWLKCEDPSAIKRRTAMSLRWRQWNLCSFNSDEESLSQWHSRLRYFAQVKTSQIMLESAALIVLYIMNCVEERKLSTAGEVLLTQHLERNVS